MVVGQHVGRVHPRERLVAGILKQARRADGQGPLRLLQHHRDLLLHLVCETGFQEGPVDLLVLVILVSESAKAIVLYKLLEHVSADYHRPWHHELDIGELAAQPQIEHAGE